IPLSSRSVTSPRAAGACERRGPRRSRRDGGAGTPRAWVVSDAMPSPGRRQMMMKQQRRRSAFPRAVLAILAGSLLLNACGGKADKAGEAPAVVEQVRGTKVNRVAVSPQAPKPLSHQDRK